jgi:hypothetical protein
MGCFNATCSLSDLTIGHGDKCLLFPLIPVGFNSDKNGVIKIGPSSMYVSNEGSYMFFTPMCFPIKGEYNDYGSLENIEEDENIKAIEKYFGMKIEDFVAIITDGRRGMDDSYSDFFNHFAINKKILDKEMGSGFLTALGFKEISENTFSHPEAEKFSVRLIKIKGEKKGYPFQPYSYEIIKADKVIKKDSMKGYNSHRNFLNDFADASGFILNVKLEDQDKVKFLSAASGMFILGDIYNFYAKEKRSNTFGNEKYLSSEVLESMGFKLRCIDESIERYNKVYEFPGVTDYVMNGDGTWSHLVKTTPAKPNTGKQNHNHSVYHPVELVKVWKKLTGIDLPVSDELLNLSEYDYNFKELQNKMLETEKKRQEYRKDTEEFIEGLKENLSNPESFEQSFKAFIDNLSKEENQKFLEQKDPFGFDEDSEGEDEDDFDGMSKKIREMSKQIRESNAMMKKFVDPSLSEKEKKVLYRKRLEDTLSKQESKDEDDDILSYTSPLGSNMLCMQFPLPRHTFRDFNFCDKIYKNQIADGTIQEAFVDFCHFYWGMQRNHRFFQPASYGSQEDNAADRKELAEKIIQVAKERLKEYEEA